MIERLPGAGAVREGDGGTAYLLYRRDRFRCSGGEGLLKEYKIRAASGTKRVVAGCCNSAMFMTFERGPHWVCGYRARFEGDIPPVEMRVCTKGREEGVKPVGDVAEYRGIPARLVWRLVAARVGMMVGR